MLFQVVFFEMLIIAYKTSPFLSSLPSCFFLNFFSVQKKLQKAILNLYFKFHFTFISLTASFIKHVIELKSLKDLDEII